MTDMYSPWSLENLGQLAAVAIVTTCIVTTPEVVGLSEHVYVRHYEPALYDHVALQQTHHVTRRSADEHIHFRFKAYGRTFSVRLTRDVNVLHSDIVVETSHHTVPYDVTRAYNGHLEGEPAHLHGIITTSGHFEGNIYTDQETYSMEKADRHFPETLGFHTVIYKHSDVTLNQSLTSCLHDRLYKRQKEMTHAIHKRAGMPNKVKKVKDDFNHIYKDGMSVTSDKHTLSLDNDQRLPVRKARAVDPAKVTCELYMQADHLYYQKYNSDIDVVIEKLAQHVQAVNEIYRAVGINIFYQKHNSDIDVVIEKLAQHVQAVNEIYRAVYFDESGAPDNIGFVIKKIKVYTDPDVAGYKYSGPMDVEYFLDKHSEDDYDAFCLSYMFTHRDFSDGVLGLAWIGDTSASGGVCERHVLYNNVGKSLNTGIVTTLNYGMEIPAAVSHVTFAHELGHNFGSPHDSDNNAICAPGGEVGNYIMYAHATSGNMPNNNKLSSCSIASIGRVLEAKARSDSGCFVEHTDALCGNRVVEGSEECDCGWQEECTEGCCNPQLLNTTGGGTPCTIKDTSVCSPSQGPCCDTSCQFLGVATPCRPASDCLKQAFCTGSSAECPASAHVNDTTPCGDTNNFLVCLKGECTGSVCLAYGREPCQCSGSSPDNWKDKVLCHVCCQDGAQCRSSFDLDDVPDALSVSGSACNNYGGYCDIFKKCRQVDPSGPLNNLKRLFLSGEALDNLKTWLTAHWYVGVGGAVGLICIIGLVVKFCTKSSQKRVAPTDHGSTKKTPRHHRDPYHMSPERWI